MSTNVGDGKVELLRFKNSINQGLDQRTVKGVAALLEEGVFPITYGDLSKKVDELFGQYTPPLGFRYALGRIQDYCLVRNLPPLPVFVVNKDTEKPGPGFIKRYLPTHPGISKSEEEIITAELDRCLKQESWQELYDEVELSEKAPILQNLAAQYKAWSNYREAARTAGVFRTEIERNAEARACCLAIKGYRCTVCGKMLEEEYGIPGIIHVHHLHPLSETKGERYVDPEKDLIPVCPNCHAAIHSKKGKGCYTPNEVREMLALPPLDKY